MLTFVEMRRTIGLILVKAVPVCLLLCAAGPPAFGIAITNASDPGYVTGDGNYTGVAEILFNYAGQPGTFLCTGALISDFQILTAGHCAVGAENWSVTFDTPSGTTTLGVSQVSVHPDYGPRPAPLSQLDQYDIAILTLAAIAPSDAARYPLLTSFGSAFPDTPLDIVGFGLGGSVATGILPLGVRRHAVNTIDGLYPYPDSPFEMTLQFGAKPGEYGLSNLGDSGAPAFFNGQIVGLTTFGNLPTVIGYNPAFTYINGDANLLDATTGEWVEASLIPEPGTLGLLASGLLGLLLLRRHRTPSTQLLHSVASRKETARELQI